MICIGFFDPFVCFTDKEILTIQGKTVQLKPNLNCKTYGIYVAVCTRCDSSYVGQTKNSFSKRRTAHRFKWNRSKTLILNIYQMKMHCLETIIKYNNNLKRLNFNDAYEVAFWNNLVLRI